MADDPYEYMDEMEAVDDEIASYKDLIERLIGDDPLTRSQEGLDDGCFFCGAYTQTIYISPNFHSWAEHWTECPWVQAMQLLGRDLGRHTIYKDSNDG